MTARYQEPRDHGAPSAVRWNGVTIETARGAKVRAPYFGRVVYADWLQGMGLLLIIAHSGNFLTLYGHAEVLYKSVGDRVAAGDVIGGRERCRRALRSYTSRYARAASPSIRRPGLGRTRETRAIAPRSGHRNWRPIAAARMLPPR